MYTIFCPGLKGYLRTSLKVKYFIPDIPIKMMLNNISASVSRHQHCHWYHFCLTKCLMKKYTTNFFLELSHSASEPFQCSCLFPDNFLQPSTKLASKTQYFLQILAVVQSTYSVESVSTPVFVETKSTGEVISGVLKSCKEEDCSLQACNLLSGNSNRGHFLKMFCKSRVCKEFKLQACP